MLENQDKEKSAGAQKKRPSKPNVKADAPQNF